MSLGIVLVMLAVIATVVSLVGGISSMAVAHDIGHTDEEHWMIRRVVLQGVAILLLALVSFIPHLP